MRKKQSRNISERNPQLVDSLHGAPAGIDDELFVSNFDERAGSEAIQSWGWRSGPQKSNPKKISRWFHHELLPIPMRTALLEMPPMQSIRYVAKELRKKSTDKPSSSVSGVRLESNTIPTAAGS